MNKPIFASEGDESLCLIDRTVNTFGATNESTWMLFRHNSTFNIHKFILSSTTIATLCVSVSNNDLLNRDKFDLLESPYYTFDTSVNSLMRHNIQLIRNLYDCLNISSINLFLNAYDHLIPDLIKCQGELSRRFGNIILTMELVVDSELAEWKTIFITVPVVSNFESSYLTLNSFFKEWLINQTIQFRQKVTIRLQ